MAPPGSIFLEPTDEPVGGGSGERIRLDLSGSGREAAVMTRSGLGGVDLTKAEHTPEREMRCND